MWRAPADQGPWIHASTQAMRRICIRERCTVKHLGMPCCTVLIQFEVCFQVKRDSNPGTSWIVPYLDLGSGRMCTGGEPHKPYTTPKGYQAPALGDLFRYVCFFAARMLSSWQGLDMRFADGAHRSQAFKRRCMKLRAMYVLLSM